jgi:tetratricopeptide (TPR) repeat protein
VVPVHLIGVRDEWAVVEPVDDAIVVAIEIARVPDPVTVRGGLIRQEECLATRTRRCLPPRARTASHLGMPDKYELYDQAVDLVAEGKTEEAVARYREALALDGDFADGWQGMALALNQLGRHTEAIDAAKRLCELTPDDVLAHTTLSRMYQAANMIPEAEAAGAKARVLDWKRQLKEGQ